MADTKKRGGTEMFYRDRQGRKQDAALHAAILGPEADDPFAFDLDEFAKLSPGEQDRFLRTRPGGGN